MKITVIAKPRSKRPGVKRIDETTYEVAVSSPATEGKANEAIIKALSYYFGIAPSRISIIRGETGRKKLLQVL